MHFMFEWLCVARICERARKGHAGRTRVPYVISLAGIPYKTVAVSVKKSLFFLGITNFDLLGDFGAIEWLGNFQIVLLYNLVFGTTTALCLANKFTATVRQELCARLVENYVIFTNYMSFINWYFLKRRGRTIALTNSVPKTQEHLLLRSMERLGSGFATMNLKKLVRNYPIKSLANNFNVKNTKTRIIENSTTKNSSKTNI